jgi:hypothetical protein
MMHALADELLRVVEEAAVELRTLDATTIEAKRAPDAWSVKEIIGHLIDSATNNHQRFVRAQQVEMFVFPEYEQDEWVRLQDYQGRSWAQLVDFWQLYNRQLAHIIRRIPEDRLRVDCRIGSAKPVSLGYLLEDYLAHLRHHLKEIEERRDVMR